MTTPPPLEKIRVGVFKKIGAVLVDHLLHESYSCSTRRIGSFSPLRSCGMAILRQKLALSVAASAVTFFSASNAEGLPLTLLGEVS